MEQTQSQHAGHWYVLAGIAIAILAYFLIFNSRSVSAEDLAVQLYAFIEGSVLDEKKIGTKNFWVEEFRCNNVDCQAYLKVGLPPPLYLNDLGLLAEATKDDSYRKKQLAFNVLLASVCRRDISTCERFFITLFEDAGNDANIANLSQILARNYQKKPNTLPRWFSKLHRFAVLYEKTKKPEDLEKIKKIFSDEFDSLFEKAKGAVAYSEKGQDIYAGSCYKPLGALKIYKATGDEKYLEVATQFADTANLAGHAKDFDISDEMKDRLVHPNLLCADLLLSLYEEIDDKKYLDGAKNLVQYSVRNNFDLPEHKLLNGKGAFVRSYPENSARQHSHDTLWAINILLRMPGGTDFKVPKRFSIASIVRAQDGDGADGSEGGQGDSSDTGGDAGAQDTGGPDTAGPDTGAPDGGPQDFEDDIFGNEPNPDPNSTFEEDPFGFEPHDPNAPIEVDIVASLVDIVDIIEPLEPISFVEPPSVYEMVARDIAQALANSVFGPNGPELDFNAPAFGLDPAQAQALAQAAVEALGFTDPQDFVGAINDAIGQIDSHYGTNFSNSPAVNDMNNALNDLLGTGNSGSNSGAASGPGGENNPGESYRILQCNDGIDNDGDGFIDGADSHCYPY